MSRAPLPITKEDTHLQDSAEKLMEVTIANLPVSNETLVKYSEEQTKDLACSTFIQYCEQGWPQLKSQLKSAVEPYWEHRGSLTMKTGLLYNHCIVIPSSMQKETTEKIHQGHQEIKKCRSRVKRAIWCLGLS